jgi:SAM-dependent methyltransferase
MPEPPPYRDFYYPLNVFMHILTLEEGEVHDLHYGLFERGDESIAEAQERSTELLLAHLPPPPARVLDVGAGLGTTLWRLLRDGYDAEGISPDARQIEMLHARHGNALRIHTTSFEDFADERPFDVLVFQESSQYIDSQALFKRASGLAPRIVVLDEFALRDVPFPGALHRLDEFLEGARESGFLLRNEADVSESAAPTIEYFTRRLPQFRDILIADLGLTDQQVDELIESGNRYRELYRSGAYGYRLLCFERGAHHTAAKAMMAIRIPTT